MLVVDNLSFWYDRGLPPIVYGASFQVGAEQVVAIVGASGAGKTTLLRLCSGLMQMQIRRYGAGGMRLTGSVSYKQQPLTEPSHEFSYVPQNCWASLMPGKSARDNILMAVGSKGISKLEENRADRLLAATNMAGIGHLAVVNLSGGQRQRVAVCRALVSEPSIVFMDEPFASLDSGLKPTMGDLLSAMRNDRRLAVVMVTHDIKEAVRIADMIVGTRVTHGRPEYHSWLRQDPDCTESHIDAWVSR